MSGVKIERIRVDVWASIRPVIEAEMNRTGLTANEVVNIALADYFGLTPNNKKSVNTPHLEITPTTEETEDYI